MPLTALSMEAFARKLASANPTPGGGSVAAAVGSFGAGLVRMVALLTSKSPKHADVAARCEAIGESAGILSETLLRLVDEDARAFDRVSDAYRLSRSTAEEKATRSAAIQRALAGAIVPPSLVIQHAREICHLAVELADIGNQSALSDIGCAALCAQSAAQGAALNVESNARSLKERAAAREYLDRANQEIAQVNLLSEVILGKLRATVELG